MLLEICHQQREEIQVLQDEIARLKSQKPNPQIRPSRLEGDDKKNRSGQRRSHAKQNKTSQLEIHETVMARPDGIPQGSRFKDYQDFMVQDIRIALHNTRYRLERWMTPSGETIVGQLPPEVVGHQFGTNLRAYILHQYDHAHVTQTLILGQLREWGVKISTGEISAIITEGKNVFHSEKEALLPLGVQCSAFVHVDDIETRHQGINGSNRVAQKRRLSAPSRQGPPKLNDASTSDLAFFDVLADIAASGAGSPTDALSPVICRAANRAIRFSFTANLNNAPEN